MMNARTQLAELLRQHIDPDAALTVEDAPRIPAPLGARFAGTVVVQRTRMTPAPNRQGGYVSDFALWLFVATRSLDHFEDDLDDALDATLAAVEAIGSAVMWTTAERDSVPDEDGNPAYHGYRIDLQVATTKE